jgi:hypothetical protein
VDFIEAIMPSRLTSCRLRKTLKEGQTAVAEQPKKERKTPVRTPASAIMKTVAAMERLIVKLPEQDRPRALAMFSALVARPLFDDKQIS